MPTTLSVKLEGQMAYLSEVQNLMNLDALSIMNMLIQTTKEKMDMNLPEWLVGMQLTSMLCGGTLFVVTIDGGYFFIKGLESLKGDLEDGSDQE